MKKLLKRTFSLLCCVLMLLTGCTTTPKSSLPEELRAPNTNYPDTVNILAPYIFQHTTAVNADQIKQQWIDEMSQRYGVKFNILTNSYTESGEYDASASSKVRDVQFGDTTYKGLFRISGLSSSNASLNINLEYGDNIVPLEDYLADNPTWNALPEDFKSLFEMDGHIYAIPTSVSWDPNARVIHNEALEKTGITVTDLDSFREFCITYAQKTGNAAIGCVDAYEMTDILNAFGLYTGVLGLVPFAYDPTENCYVDWLTKDAAIEALEYLRELYKAGAIYLSFKPDRTKFESGIFASNYGGYSGMENITNVLTLNPEYPQVPHTSRDGYAMTKDTPQPKETINLLVDMLFGSEQNYLECWLGTSDNYTLNSDGTITIEMAKDSEGNYVYPCMPRLTGGLSDIFPYSDANIFYSRNGVVSMEQDNDTGKYNSYLQLKYDLVKTGTVVKLPMLFQNMKSPTYTANSRDADKLYMECFQNAIISKDKTVQQVVDEYKEAMLNLGGNAMLDEMNAAIGKQTAYYYG